MKHGVEDVFGHSGTAEALMVKYGLTPEKIVEKAKQAGADYVEADVADILKYV